MFGMSNLVLMIITIVAATIGSIVNAIFPKRFYMTPYTAWRYTFYKSFFGLVSIALMYLAAGADFTLSIFSVLLGLWLAVCCSCSIFVLTKAYETGPVTYTSVIIALSAIIPTFSGLFLFGEAVTPIQYAGVVLMAICLVLSVDTGKEHKAKKANAKWLIYCAVGFVFSGSVGVIQKIHQNSAAHKAEMPALLLTAFLVSSVISATGLLTQVKSKPDKSIPEYAVNSKKFIIYPIITGAFWGVNHVINLPLAHIIPSVVFFPLVNLSPTILLALYAVIIYGERMSRRRWVGLIVGFLSVILLSGVIKF